MINPLEMLSLARRTPLFLSRAIGSTVRIAVLRALFPGFRAHGRIHIGPGCDIYVQRGGTLTIRDCHLSRGVTLTSGRGAHLELEGVYVGQFSTIVAREEVRIEAGTKIGERVTVRDSNHDHSVPLSEGRFNSSSIRIGRDVWLGANVVVLAGVVIGDGATVGASAVVTTKVDAGATVVGIPARPIVKAE